MAQLLEPKKCVVHFHSPPNVLLIWRYFLKGSLKMYLMRFTIRVGQGRGGADIFDLLILRCSD